MARLELDLVIPCYNPVDGWEENLVEIYNKIEEKFAPIKINCIVVNDGSGDGFSIESLLYIRDEIKNIEVISYSKNRGKGYAVRKGVEIAKSDNIIYTDCDIRYTDKSYFNVIESLINGSDIVVAVSNPKYRCCVPILRRVLLYLLRHINRLIFRIKIKDTQGGLKGINSKGRDTLLKTTIDTSLFDTQFIYRAEHEHNLRVEQVESRLKSRLRISKLGLSKMYHELINLKRILMEGYA